MKKFIIVMGILLIGWSLSSTAYAGTINSYEQEVISAAQGTFRYNGEDYRLDPSYVSQLSSYLAQDSVDLTSSDRDTVMQSIDGYIEQGVQQGYLKPVNQQSGSNSSGGSSGSNSSDSSSGNNSTSGSTGNTGSGSSSDTSSNTSGDNNQGSVTGPANTDNSGTGNGSTDNQTQNNNTQDSGNGSTPVTVISDNDNQTDPSTPDSSLGDFLDNWLDGSDKDGNSSTDSKQINDADHNNSIDNSDSSISSSDKEQSEDINAPIIKETGFDLTWTFIMVILLGVIMMAGIGVTVRHHYFGESDE